MKIIFIRHGQSEGNVSGRFTGHKNVALTELGRSQAEAVCEYVWENLRFDSIYSSDLSRAFDTVSPLAEKSRISIVKSEALREISVGRWEGELFDEIREREPEIFAVYRDNIGGFVFPEGESFTDVCGRVSRFLNELYADLKDKTVVIGTHGGVIRRMCAMWKKLSPDELTKLHMPGNASVTVVEYDGVYGEILQYGFDSFLNPQAVASAE